MLLKWQLKSIKMNEWKRKFYFSPLNDVNAKLFCWLSNFCVHAFRSLRLPSRSKSGIWLKAIFIFCIRIFVCQFSSLHHPAPRLFQQWIYYHLDLTPDYHVLWQSETYSWLKYRSFQPPLYPIPSPPTEWTNWPINNVHVSNLNWRQFFLCQNNHKGGHFSRLGNF